MTVPRGELTAKHAARRLNRRGPGQALTCDESAYQKTVDIPGGSPQCSLTRPGAGSTLGRGARRYVAIAVRRCAPGHGQCGMTDHLPSPGRD